jgi:hypothetical protein
MALLLVIIFLGLNVFANDVAAIFMPLTIFTLAVYTFVSGILAYHAAYTGIPFLDARPNLTRTIGVVWLFVGGFLGAYSIGAFFSLTPPGA